MNGVLGLVALPLRPVAAVARAAFPVLVRPLVAAVLDAVDLTALIREHLDVNELAGDLDLDAVLARIDLAALARQVIDEIDLPELVRDSAGTLTSETVRGVRAECARADDAVADLVGRVLRRSPVSQP